jgi:hypothetical protein
MAKLDFEVLIDPNAPPLHPKAVTFETGARRSDVADPSLWAYEHHGEGFSPVDPGALTALFEDLVLGRPLPMTFLTHRVRDVDTLVAIAAFVFRDVVLHPRMLDLVAKVDLVHRRGFQLLGHLTSEDVRFLRLLRGYFPDGLTRREQGDRLRTALGWIRDYVLEERLPALGAALVGATELQRGSDGFVVGVTGGSLTEGWVDLFRKGHLRGILFGPRVEGQPTALIARKSAYVALDLVLAERLLNEVEAAAGGPTGWAVAGDWLWGPVEGTRILASHIIEVLLRC